MLSLKTVVETYSLKLSDLKTILTAIVEGNIFE